MINQAGIFQFWIPFAIMRKKILRFSKLGLKLNKIILILTLDKFTVILCVHMIVPEILGDLMTRDFSRSIR